MQCEPRARFTLCRANCRDQPIVVLYGVGPGAVEPAGIGEGASVEPCVFGGFLRADLLDAGVGDGLLIAAVVAVLVPVVPDCSHDARNVMPIKTAMTEIICFFIGYNLLRAAQSRWLLPNSLLAINSPDPAVA